MKVPQPGATTMGSDVEQDVAKRLIRLLDQIAVAIR